MKILIISTNADEAGAPRHVETIVNGLSSKYQLIIVFGENGPVSTRLKNSGHAVHIVSEMRTAISPIKDLIALFKIIKLVHRTQPDIVHCHSAKAGMLGRMAAFFNGKQWIYTVHGWGWRGVSSLTRKTITFIEKLLSKLPLGFYIFVAKDVMREAIRVIGLNEDRGTIVHNGVPLIKACPPPDSLPLVILMPARVTPAKDHKSLLLAFERLDDSSSRLFLCGEGTDSSEFMAFAKSLAPRTFTNITFFGQRSDVDVMYSQSHVVALISHFEAFPLSIIEAMSCGRSIVATNVGGIPELINSGVNGILVKPKCVDDIVDALTRYRDERIRIDHGNNAKSTYNKFYTEKSMIESISRIYNSLAPGLK